jgi:hypothetical protein
MLRGLVATATIGVTLALGGCGAAGPSIVAEAEPPAVTPSPTAVPDRGPAAARFAVREAVEALRVAGTGRLAGRSRLPLPDMELERESVTSFDLKRDMVESAFTITGHLPTGERDSFSIGFMGVRGVAYARGENVPGSGNFGPWQRGETTSDELDLSLNVSAESVSLTRMLESMRATSVSTTADGDSLVAGSVSAADALYVMGFSPMLIQRKVNPESLGGTAEAIVRIEANGSPSTITISGQRITFNKPDLVPSDLRTPIAKSEYKGTFVQIGEPVTIIPPTE